MTEPITERRARWLTREPPPMLGLYHDLKRLKDHQIRVSEYEEAKRFLAKLESSSAQNTDSESGREG